MSKWTDFRIIFNCFNTKEEIVDILGKPTNGIEEVINCNLPIGSEGSLDYSIFKRGSHENIVVIIGSLRDYTQDQGRVWYNETIIKFKHPHTQVLIIE